MAFGSFTEAFRVFEFAFGQMLFVIVAGAVVFDNLDAVQPMFNVIAPDDDARFIELTDRLDLLIFTSRDQVIKRSGGAIAFTTYQAGKLFLLGLKSNGKLGVFERTFTRCMGVAVSGDSRTLLLATQYQLFRFDNALPPGSLQDHHDAVYVPRLSWITGDLDIHDVGFGGDGTPLFVNTRFSCLAAA